MIFNLGRQKERKEGRKMIVKVEHERGWQMFSGFDRVEWYPADSDEPIVCLPECYDFALPTDNKAPHDGVVLARNSIFAWKKDSQNAVQIIANRAFILNDDGKTIERI